MAASSVKGVAHGEIIPLWKKVEPLIQMALDKGNGEWEAGDILAFLLSRDMQLWRTEDLTAAAVTQIVNFPRKRICEIVLIGGEGLKDWANSKVIETWAKAQGCDLMRGYGRKGWARAVGWKETQSIAIKEL